MRENITHRRTLFGSELLKNLQGAHNIARTHLVSFVMPLAEMPLATKIEVPPCLVALWFLPRQRIVYLILLEAYSELGHLL